MAWLLILVRDNWKVALGETRTWRAGDIVEVRDDAWVTANGWGSKESEPPPNGAFYRIQVQNVEFGNAKRLLERVQNRLEWVNLEDGGEWLEIMERIRRHRFYIADLTVSQRNKLTSSGILGGGDAITRVRAIACIRDNDGGGISLLAG